MNFKFTTNYNMNLSQYPRAVYNNKQIYAPVPTNVCAMHQATYAKHHQKDTFHTFGCSPSPPSPLPLPAPPIYADREGDGRGGCVGDERCAAVGEYRSDGTTAVSDAGSSERMYGTRFEDRRGDGNECGKVDRKCDGDEGNSVIHPSCAVDLLKNTLPCEL